MGGAAVTRTPLARLDERSPRVWSLALALYALYARRGRLEELPGKPAEAKRPWVSQEAPR
jgi:hypothetical protein